MSTRAEWPTFALDYEFNPGDEQGFPPLAPDQLVVFDPSNRRRGWLTATRGSYVSLEDIR